MATHVAAAIARFKPSIMLDFRKSASQAVAFGIFREVLKGMKIVPVPSRDPLYVSGNIHCGGVQITDRGLISKS